MESPRIGHDLSRQSGCPAPTWTLYYLNMPQALSLFTAWGDHSPPSSPLLSLLGFSSCVRCSAGFSSPQYSHHPRAVPSHLPLVQPLRWIQLIPAPAGIWGLRVSGELPMESYLQEEGFAWILLFQQPTVENKLHIHYAHHRLQISGLQSTLVL